MTTAEQVLRALEGRKYISITTYRKSGKGVSTPVEFVIKDSAIYVRAREGSGKIRRVLANPNVTVAPCTLRGIVTGPSFEGTAVLIDDDGALYPLFSHKYGLLWKLGTRIRKTTHQPMKIVPKTVESQ
ncbi:MAG TPA: PPOX class F420-dependent oxidoreductase [Conexivisphaerales archaeon]|nr:PPOX class F420-dependent oxidoreductase [Conexivisphaerales archaeon]